MLSRNHRSPPMSEAFNLAPPGPKIEHGRPYRNGENFPPQGVFERQGSAAIESESQRGEEAGKRGAVGEGEWIGR